jgi:hypothetical protein
MEIRPFLVLCQKCDACVMMCDDGGGNLRRTWMGTTDGLNDPDGWRDRIRIEDQD